MHLGQKYLSQPHLVPLPHLIPAPTNPPPPRACGSHLGIHSLSSYRYSHTSLNKFPLGTGSFPGHAQLGVRLKMKTPRLLSSFAAVLWECTHGHRGASWWLLYSMMSVYRCIPICSSHTWPLWVHSKDIKGRWETEDAAGIMKWGHFTFPVCISNSRVGVG